MDICGRGGRKEQDSWPLPSAQVAAISDKNNRDDQRREGAAQCQVSTTAAAFPLLQENPYEGAKKHQHRHVEGPTGEPVQSHVGVCHAIEEELPIPQQACNHGKREIRGQKVAGRAVGKRDIFAQRAVFPVKV